MDEKIKLKEYYKNKYWGAFSKSLLENKECTCRLCGKKRWKFQPRKKEWKRQYRFAVHHINYDYLFHESEHPECYMTLCYTCHSISHLIFRLRSSILYTELAAVLEKYGFKYIKEQ